MSIFVVKLAKEERQRFVVGARAGQNQAYANISSIY